MNREIVCKLIQMGAEILEREISENPTVEGLFDACDIDFPDDHKVTRRGVDVTPETRLFDGDRVFVGKKVKGNQDGDPFEVQLIKMGQGGGIKNLPATEGMTIAAVIDQLEAKERASYYKADGSPAYEYRIGTEKYEGSHILKKPFNDKPIRVILSQKVKGN